jgi:hypothetical protein
MSEYIFTNIGWDQKNIKNSHSLNLQMSALSFLIGQSNDKALIEFTPNTEYLRQIEKLNLPVQSYTSWDELTTSSIVNSWQSCPHLEKKCHLRFPYHSLKQDLDSKAFILNFCTPAFDSFLILAKEDILPCLKNKEGKYVLKTKLGQSGQGHYFFQAPYLLDHKSLPDIDYESARLERWVDRAYDFSSQWLLDDKVYHLGICELRNNSKGVYQSSIFPRLNQEFDDFIEEHLCFTKPIIDDLYLKGYRGHLGIDAFIYRDENQFKLCPIIEINPRKTMGYVALFLAHHFNKTCIIELGDGSSPYFLLPKSITINSQPLIFKKNLNLKLL